MGDTKNKVEKRGRLGGEIPMKIGLRVPQWATQNARLVKGIVHFVRGHGKSWQIDADIFFNNELPSNEIDADWDGDGLIVFRCNEAEVAAWQGRRIPVVNISSETQIKGVPNVLVDNYHMGTLAAEYLMGLGLRDYAYVGERTRNYSSQRYNGFRDKLESRGMTCQEINLPISKMSLTQKASNIHKRLNLALASLSFPIGILVRDDLLSLNVLRSAQTLGIQVPDDISLIGINDQSPYCQVAFPRLTSVMYPGELIGYRAAELLNRMINGEVLTSDVILTSSGVRERGSTNAVAVRDELVAKAVKYIRQHAKTNALSVADLCRQLGVSNTTLRLRFKKMMGCSIKSEVDRVRFQEIRFLLTETHSSIQEIAFQLGFTLPEDLTRFFTRMEGQSPMKYRMSRR